MALRIPQNQIIYKYTPGKEYIFNSTYREYIGYYYEMSGKKYAGKEYNSNAPILISMKSPNINTLLTKASTYIYGRISNVNIPNNKVSSINFIPTDEDTQKGQSVRYFASKNTISPTIIKEIDKETYNKLQTDPLYITVSIKVYIDGDALDNTYTFDSKEVDQAEKKLPGIKTFLAV